MYISQIKFVEKIKINFLRLKFFVPRIEQLTKSLRKIWIGILKSRVTDSLTKTKWQTYVNFKYNMKACYNNSSDIIYFA